MLLLMRLLCRDPLGKQKFLVGFQWKIGQNQILTKSYSYNLINVTCLKTKVNTCIIPDP